MCRAVISIKGNAVGVHMQQTVIYLQTKKCGWSAPVQHSYKFIKTRTCGWSGHAEDSYISGQGSVVRVHMRYTFIYLDKKVILKCPCKGQLYITCSGLLIAHLDKAVWLESTCGGHLYIWTTKCGWRAIVEYGDVYTRKWSWSAHEKDSYLYI